MGADLWDPDQYGRFEAERDRAALDLLDRLPDDLNPDEVWDLGCGAGQHAVRLSDRYPSAQVHGLDASAAMLEQARALAPGIDWRLGDIAAWEPARAADLIFANASLQWLPDVDGALRRLSERLASRGTIAVQMPMAHETLHHGLMRSIGADGPWAGRLAGVATLAPLPGAEACYAALAERCEDVDVWSTTYLHALSGPDAVVEWMKGTALRPWLTVLEDDPAIRAAFLETFRAALAEAFPRRLDGVTLLPFPRLFLVARRR